MKALLSPVMGLQHNHAAGDHCMEDVVMWSMSCMKAHTVEQSVLHHIAALQRNTDVHT